MKTFATRGVRVVVGMVAACLAFSAPVSAQAAAAGILQGSGTISPGLGATPAPQTYTLSGSLTGAGAAGGSAVVVNDSCSYSGSSSGLGDNVAFGLGTMSGSCTGSLAITDTMTVVRVGAIALEAGPDSTGGVAGEAIHICIWIATQAPPITNYIHVCVWIGWGA